MQGQSPRSKYDTLIGSVRIAYEQEGMTDKEIGEMLGLAKETIYSWRVKAGIKSSPRPKKYHKPSREVLQKEWDKSIETKPRGGIGGLLSQGSSVRVAEALGVTSDIAKKWLKEEGILEPRKMFKTHGKEAVRLYTEEGLPVYRVAEEMGISESTASSWLKKSGVEIIPSLHRRTKEENIAANRKQSETKKGTSRSIESRMKQSEWHAKRKHLFYESRDCEVCGFGFEVRSKVSQRYCSSRCSGIANEASTRVKFGTNNAQREMSEYAIRVLSSKEDLVRHIGDRKVTIEQLGNELGVSSFPPYERVVKYDLWHLVDRRVSTGEKQLSDEISMLGVNWERTSKILPSRYEIDIFIPNKNIGIEYNGSYWHSEIHKDRLYHQKKSKLAEEAGIHLIHVWEYDWEEKREQYLSIIRNALGLNERKIAARRCEVREISSAEKKEFLEEHHFQGNDNAQIRLGLFFEEELVSVMTFGRARFVEDQKIDFELLRFCSKSGVSVQGGASKLFAHFRKMHPSASVLSYSDNGRTTGSLYKTLGFRMSHESSPSYIWTNYEDVFSRYQTQVHRLKEDPVLQEKYGDPLQSMSEADIMQAEGYVRVYDAGSKVWVYQP